MEQTKGRDRTEALIPLVLDRSVETPLKRQLYLCIRAEIVSGRLPSGARLPTSRALARAHNLSRSTIVEAFEQLAADGLIHSRVGSGSYVSAVRPHAPVSSGRARSVASRSALSKRAQRILPARVTHVARARVIGAFRNGLPAIDLFPKAQWARYLSRSWRSPASERSDYDDGRGYPALRRAIAERLTLTRSVRCDPDQIIVVEGTQQALDLIAQVVIDPGNEVCVEDPGYPGARDAFAAAGARLVPVPVDDEGIVVARALTRSPRAIYVCPSHQYPLGVALSLSRRLELLAWARRAGAWVVEDDFENEFEYEGRPLTSLQSLDTDDRVIYVGTFSKTMVPSLRIGYIIVPPHAVDVFAAARAVGGRGGKIHEQAALAAFIEDGAFARHVHRMRDIYRERQAVLIEEVEDRLAGIASIRKASSGIHLLARFDASIDDVRVSRIAAENSIDASPVSPLSLRPNAQRGVLLGYAVASPPEIRAGVATLARCIAASRRR